MTTASKEIEEEISWTDACIRWDDAPSVPPSTQKNNNNNDDDNDDKPFDPFADPDPTEEFNFTFQKSNSEEIVLTLTGYKADSDETWQSTGLTLWKASHQLNDYILCHYNEWKGTRVLELGAGLGVCGILLDRLLQEDPSSTMICLTDGDTEALTVLRQNIQRNNSQATCRQLLWGKETATRFDSNPYQVIVASDIIYAPSVLVPLWETIQVLLAEDGIFVLAFAKRKVPVQVDDVLNAATEFGFVYNCVLDENDEGVFLYEFRRAV